MIPYYMYKITKGEVKAKLFDTPKSPAGWFDSPHAARAAVEAKKLEKRLEASNDYSSRNNKQFI